MGSISGGLSASPNIIGNSLAVYEINSGINNLLTAVGTKTVHVYTPRVLAAPAAGLGAAVPNVRAYPLLDHPLPGVVNIENGAPLFSGESVTLQTKAQGIVLTGSTAARIVGHAANQYSPIELLVGNDGNDTIAGGGGSGTIVSSSGRNKIHTGSGDVVVYSHGAGDVIKAGGGIDNVDAYGTATVVGGSGILIFTDSGTAGSAFLVRAGSGATIAYSGRGSDTFVGGSGVAYFQDSGPGGVTFAIAAGAGGFDIISGFDKNAGHSDTLAGSFFTHLAKFDTAGGGNSKITVVGGSAFIHLGNTNVVFLGVTSIGQITGT
ncbi:MAG TPA: hypothetical protein VKS60_07900 [Stellaceae bacterium]|nr:hypothetical protein [Stellaceae bacterium]